MKNIHKIRGRPKSGFTLVEIMIVVAVIGLLSAIAIPNFVRARIVSQTSACINNLRQIDAAKQQWALETGKPSTQIPENTDILIYVGKSGMNGKDVCCPLTAKDTELGGYSGHIGTVNVLPFCGNFDSATHAATLNPDGVTKGSPAAE
jgi:prepilin-type N-terminal cleavage/methylation domain-containing protein